jgi:hypothetical protein
MKKQLACVAILSFGLLGNASASVIGTLFTGSAGDISVSNNGITWNTDSSSTPAGPPWNGEVASGTALNFAGCVGGLGSAGCLSVTEGIEINNAVALTPLSVLPEDFFLRFAAHPLLDFKLVDVLPGSSNTNCAGLSVNQSCSPFLGSPIVLTLLAGNRTGATINFDGVASDNGGATFTSNWVGGFSATIPTMTPAQLQALFCPGGVCIFGAGSPVVSASNSGSFFATSIPEPGSLAMIGGGLLGLAALLRRKKAA